MKMVAFWRLARRSLGSEQRRVPTDVAMGHTLVAIGSTKLFTKSSGLRHIAMRLSASVVGTCLRPLIPEELSRMPSTAEDPRTEFMSETTLSFTGSLQRAVVVP